MGVLGEREAMMPREVVELDAKLYEKRDFDAVADLYAEDMEFVAADGSVLRGRGRVLDYLKREDAAFSDAKLEWQIVAVDGPTVVQTWTWSAGPTGDPALPSGQTLPASDREVTVEAVNVTRIEDGRYTYSRRHYDRLGVLAQLGLVPGR